MEKGVGSAWGLPVVATGKERVSALALSQKLEPLNGKDPFSAERIAELEALGIGPFGRYMGGEPIKPVRISPDIFFTGDLEFKDTYWKQKGTAGELFKSHLEFLRIWGFSGGLTIEDNDLTLLLTEYINHLQKISTDEKNQIKIIVLAA